MDDLNQQARELVKELLQLDFIRDKRQWRLLTSQLWETIERLELNSQLKLMISLVRELNQEQPMEKLLRNQLLTRMILIIHESGKFSWTNNLLYRDYAEEAILQTYEYLRRSPDNYKPNHDNGASVITWLNGYLKWRIHDLKQEAQEEALHRQNPNIRGEDGEFINILDIQIAPSGSEKALILSENLRNWAENESELKTIHIRKRPEITASKIISSRLPDQEIEWQDLEREFNVSSTTLSGFYTHQCRPKIKEFVESLGYELPDTPVDPVQDIKLIINQVKKIYKADNIVEELKDWINNNSELKTIVCKQKEDLTASIFLTEALARLKENRQFRLTSLVKDLNVDQSQAEDIIAQLEKWINKNTFLPKLICEDNSDVTADIFLNKSLSLLKENQTVQIRSLVRELNINTRQANNTIEQLEEWISNNSNLQKIISKSKLYFTSDYFLNQLLFLLETKKKLQTPFFADELNIAVTKAEKFYEYRIQPKLHNWLENSGYNLREIYN